MAKARKQYVVTVPGQQFDFTVNRTTRGVMWGTASIDGKLYCATLCLGEYGEVNVFQMPDPTGVFIGRENDEEMPDSYPFKAPVFDYDMLVDESIFTATLKDSEARNG